VIEAAMLWNEPNNKSHWDFIDVDPHWQLFSAMTILAARAIAAEAPGLPRVLGGISPIDPLFIRRMQAQGVLDQLDAVAVHGFPLDWNHWRIDEWPGKIAEIRACTSLPVWVSEVGVSTFGADEVQVFGLRRSVELLRGRVPRIHWYSLYDLPRAWPATTRHKEAEGSSYYRHFHMGLVREDGSEKPAWSLFREYTPDVGLCQWFHFEDHRLDDAVKRMRELGVRYVRTGLSWADGLRPGAERWFDRLMSALDEFSVTVTFCFTPEVLGVLPHHTSAPRNLNEYADFCASMIRRYASRATEPAPTSTSARTNLAAADVHLQTSPSPAAPERGTKPPR
jgi:beta-xylosidase